MLVTVKGGTGEPVWNSPDGRVSIYEIVDENGTKWSTKSHKIGKGIGQSFEVDIEQKNGKTYLRLPPDPQYAGSQPAQQAITTPQPVVHSVSPTNEDNTPLILAIRELTQAINLTNAYQRANFGAKESTQGEPVSEPAPDLSPDTDYSPSDVNQDDYTPSDAEIAEMETTTPEQIIEIFGGEIVDDL